MGIAVERKVKEREGLLLPPLVCARSPGLRAELVCKVLSQQVDVAVLLLYTLQLAVNTVKAPLPAPGPVHVCFLSVRRCSAPSSPASP